MGLVSPVGLAAVARSRSGFRANRARSHETSTAAIPSAGERGREADDLSCPAVAHRVSNGGHFAVEGGLVALTVYATFLTARVLRDPERIGAWLPRLVAGWHQGMREAEKRKLERCSLDEDINEWNERDALQRPEVRELIKTSSRLSELHMHPDEVSVIGVHEFPEDIAAVDDLDQS